MRAIYAAILLGLGLLVAQSTRALSHDHYEPWCCNGKDCVPYHGKVEETPKGYYLPEYDTLVPYKSADGTSGKYADEAGTRYKVPNDGAQYSICVMPWEPTKVRCFYAKPGGV